MYKFKKRSLEMQGRLVEVSSREEDLRAAVPVPPWPDQFRICLPTEAGEGRVWAEFLFEWWP